MDIYAALDRGKLSDATLGSLKLSVSSGSLVLATVSDAAQ